MNLSRRYFASVSKSHFAISFILLVAFFLSVANRSLFPFVGVMGDAKWGVLLAVLCFSIFYKLTSQKSSVKFGAVSGCFAIFTVVITISSMLAQGDFTEGLKRSFSFSCLYLISCVTFFPNNPQKRIMVWSVSMAAIITAIGLLSVVPVFLGVALFRGGRLCGFASNSNTLGTACAMLVAASFALLIQSTNKKHKIYCLIVVLASLILLLMTQSRSALIGGVAGITIVAMLKHKWVLPFSIIAGFFLATAWLATETVQTDIGNTGLQIRTLNLNSRSGLWEMQLERFYTSPIIGLGLQLSGHDSKGRLGGESSYFDILGAGGILGGGALILGFLIGWYQLYQLAKKQSVFSRKDCWAAPMALAMVTAILVNSIGEGYMAAVGAMQPIYVWIIFGAVEHANKNHQY